MSLGKRIGQAMHGRRLGDTATFALTVEKQLRGTAVPQDWLDESDPE